MTVLLRPVAEDSFPSREAVTTEEENLMTVLLRPVAEVRRRRLLRQGHKSRRRSRFKKAGGRWSDGPASGRHEPIRTCVQLQVLVCSVMLCEIQIILVRTVWCHSEKLQKQQVLHAMLT